MRCDACKEERLKSVLQQVDTVNPHLLHRAADLVQQAGLLGVEGEQAGIEIDETALDVHTGHGGHVEGAVVTAEVRPARQSV